MKKLLFIFLTVSTLFSCKQEDPNTSLQTVDYMDPAQYTGIWYEISSIPQFFSAGCNCTQAEYQIRENGTVSVKNSCNLFSPSGLLNKISGTATIVEGSNNAKLNVTFFGNPTNSNVGNYWIVELANDYSYSVVGDPLFTTLFILSRSRTMPQEQIDGILTRMAALGFDVTKVKKTNQTNCQ